MDKLIIRLKEALKFIKPYLPLIDSHMVTFFTSNLWEKHVPLPIRAEFEVNSFDSVIDLFTDILANDNVQFKELRRFILSAQQMDLASTESINVLQLKDLLEINNNFRRPCLSDFMSKKKAHETEILVEVVAALTHHLGVSHVVEIGDGKGYVSTMLALQHEIKVLGLESSEIIIQGAQKRKSKLYKYWNACKKGKLPISVHRQCLVQVGVDTNINQKVQEIFPEDSPSYTLGMTGLHTCGDLSPMCLHLFTSNEHQPLPRFIINVGCCYHLLNSQDKENKRNFSGFPVSEVIRKDGFQLSRNARMMSLQALNKVVHSGKNLPESLMYRAVLEQLFDEFFGLENPKERDVGRIGVKCKNFVQYVHKASSVLGYHVPIGDDELQKYYNKFKHFEKNLYFYFMLRVVLAPVVEGIILLDKLLYLREKAFENSYLVKLFDPVLSPRCYGIVAFRDNFSDTNKCEFF